MDLYHLYNFLNGLKESFASLMQLKHINHNIIQYEMKMFAKRKKNTGALQQRNEALLLERENKPKIKSLYARLGFCCICNFLVLGFAWGLFHLLLYGVHYLFSGQSVGVIVSRITTVASWLFGAVWVLPVIVIMEIVNSENLRSIASAIQGMTDQQDCKQKSSSSTIKSTNIQYNGTDDRQRSSSLQQPHYKSIGSKISGALYSIVVAIVYLIMARCIRLFPIYFLSETVYIFLLSLLYAQYCFDYRWSKHSLTFLQRVTLIESNWSYYVGFGLPMACTAMLGSQAWCVTAMNITFPFCMLSAFVAKRWYQGEQKYFDAKDAQMSKAAETSNASFWFKPAILIVDWIMIWGLSRFNYKTRT